MSEESNANEVINSLINQVNSLTFRLYSLEKILTKLHSDKKLKSAVVKADEEIQIELQGQNDKEAQDKEGEVPGGNDHGGDIAPDISGGAAAEDAVCS